mmetsp:Transcript_4045/g.11029  ORF Transcript_4045/g.11029 Transcript_4045/m.11029 type:complete len:81 (+) Transcript_4045:485-727(+)
MTQEVCVRRRYPIRTDRRRHTIDAESAQTSKMDGCVCTLIRSNAKVPQEQERGPKRGCFDIQDKIGGGIHFQIDDTPKNV